MIRMDQVSLRDLALFAKEMNMRLEIYFVDAEGERLPVATKLPETNGVCGLELLQELCAKNEVTTRELGKILGIDYSAAARILKGQRQITAKHAKALGAHFNADPRAFWLA